MFRIPDLTDPVNEVANYVGIVMAIAAVVLPIVGAADWSTPQGIITAILALMSANYTSTKVYSIKSAKAIQEGKMNV